MNSLERIESILTDASRRGASDIHLSPGSPMMYRIDGELVPITEKIIHPTEVKEIVLPMLQPHQKAELQEKGELDFAYSLPGFSRIRVNVYRQRGTYAMALRVLSIKIPTPESLGIPRSVIELTNRKKGLVLVTGATGSGKSTTLASLISVIAKNYAKNIITLEDPVEYLHKHSRSIVNQREVGQDTLSYANALRAALRQDPDVILVGEMRDLETISIAITAAETGHLVFSTLHTNNAASTIDRMVDVFPPYQQQQIRVQLAGVLEAVVSQQLFPMLDMNGRVAAFEVMLVNSAIRNLIRENKTFQIPSIIQTNKKSGMQTMDDAIYDLYMSQAISRDTAINYAQDPHVMATRI